MADDARMDEVCVQVAAAIGGGYDKRDGRPKVIAPDDGAYNRALRVRRDLVVAPMYDGRPRIFDPVHIRPEKP